MIDVVLRTSAVLVAGFALAGIFTSRSAAVRHWIMAASLLGAVAVVPASWVTPVWTIAVPPISSMRAAAAEPSTPAATTAGPVHHATAPAPASASPLPLGVLVWGAGCLAALAIVGIGIARLSRLSAAATEVTDERWRALASAVGDTYRLRRQVILLEADAPYVPATWGARRPRVLLPPRARDWSDARRHAVLCHELAHVARADWLVQLAVQLVVALLWFNPLAWVAARELRRAAEQACDDAVLDRGVEAADYAMHLVALARDCRRPSWA
ncbi:MAG TPA: M56 family metallopeptidase, partial [Vicinamibacterales bacterium]|nr:M56 family metallopeptidase [Vicinamibacterales bacterium]